VIMNSSELKFSRKPIVRAGFTMIELLTVVIIVGILATLSTGTFMRAMEAGRQGEAKNILGSLYQAEILYFEEHQTYSDDESALMTVTPADDSIEHFFTYRITAADGATFDLTATRKLSTDTGRNPPYKSAYTITVDETGDYVVSPF
jgi:prepilin-type N-terminal cleavage/methylation domain-containing protein